MRLVGFFFLKQRFKSDGIGDVMIKNHEEADSNIFSHIAEAVKSAYDNFAILTGDKIL